MKPRYFYRGFFIGKKAVEIPPFVFNDGGEGMSENDTRRVYSVDEVSKLLNCSRNLAYKLAREKRLPGCIHLGQKRMVFSAAAIDRLLEGQGN